MHYDISLPNIPNPTRRHCGLSVPAHVADLSHNAVGVDSISDVGDVLENARLVQKRPRNVKKQVGHGRDQKTRKA